MISSQHISIPQDNLNHGVVDNIVELVSQKEEVDEEPFGTWYGDKEENFWSGEGKFGDVSNVGDDLREVDSSFICQGRTWTISVKLLLRKWRLFKKRLELELKGIEKNKKLFRVFKKNVKKVKKNFLPRVWDKLPRMPLKLKLN